MSSNERETPTAAHLEARLAELPPEKAALIRAGVVPAPAAPPLELEATREVAVYSSWQDYLERTTSKERLGWCSMKARRANRLRLMSGAPLTKLTAGDVWAVLETAMGRCVYCGSLAVENRPSKANGAPLPWGPVGRRVGSLGHNLAGFHGGTNTLDNLSWSCLWCNTWQSERIQGAIDHGGLPVP